MPGTLYVKVSIGVVAIPLRRVKRATTLKVACGEQVTEYDLTGRHNPCMKPGRQEGDPVITLRTEGGDDYPLANWPGAVAATVTDRLYWLRDGRWCLEPNGAGAWSLIQERFGPREYDLPD